MVVFTSFAGVIAYTQTALNPFTEIERKDARTGWNSDHPTSTLMCVQPLLDESKIEGSDI